MVNHSVFSVMFPPFCFNTKTLAATQTVLNKYVPCSTQHKVYVKDGEEKVTGMLFRLAGIILNLLPELPPGFTMIHIWSWPGKRVRML